MIIIPAKCQSSSSSGMSRKWGDRRTCDIAPVFGGNRNENSKLASWLASLADIAKMLMEKAANGKEISTLKLTFHP